MARDLAKDLIHHIKIDPRDPFNSDRVNDLTTAYYEVELLFSEKDREYQKELYKWALIGSSGYNPFIGQLLGRSDAELLTNQAVEAIILLETRVDRLAMLKALNIPETSMMIADAKYWLTEVINYVKIIAEKIIFVKGLEKSIMKVKSGMTDNQPEQAALEYLYCLEENEREFQEHMAKYFAEDDS